MNEITDTVIGDILVKKGLVTSENLQQCLQLQQDYSRDGQTKNLETILIERQLLEQEVLLQVRNSLVVEKDINIPGLLFIKKIGEGGMGAVYKGKQLSLDRTVAIKLLDSELSKNKNFLQRFIQEARVLAQLNHRNIVKAIDFGEVNGIYYYVMEYLKGRNLQEIVDDKGPLKEKTALGILLQMAQALEYIDQKKLIHRDVKPENMLLCRDGTTKLCDLGLAKWQKVGLSLTQEGAIVGTPYYLSPEQAQGKNDLDIRSDIYSLGASVYFMLTGKPPYEGEKATVIHFRHIYDPPPKISNVRPELSTIWDKFFEQIMAKDIDKRIQNPKKLIRIAGQLCQSRFSSSQNLMSVEISKDEEMGIDDTKTTDINVQREAKPVVVSAKNVSDTAPSVVKSKRRMADTPHRSATASKVKSCPSEPNSGERRDKQRHSVRKQKPQKHKLMWMIITIFLSLLAIAIGIGARLILTKYN